MAILKKCVLAGIYVSFFWGCTSCRHACEDTTPPAYVIDIDKTIRYQRRRPYVGAAETLQWLDRNGIAIFYLSGRTEDRRTRTEAWLKKFKFPPGKAVILKPDTEPLEDTLYYKIREIRNIQEDYRVLFGVGNSNTDFHAYQTCNVRSINRESSDWTPVRAEIEKILKENE